MRSKNQKRRTALFHLYSRNLTWVKQHPDITFIPDFDNGYICPLCFDPFFEKDLFQEASNPLTLEDVPPKSLGGKPLILACKACNSRSGHLLDAHLLNWHEREDARGFLPNSSTRVELSAEGRGRMNGRMEIDAKGRVKLDLLPRISNPKESTLFMDHMSPGRTFHHPITHPDKLFEEVKIPFSMRFQHQPDERVCEVGLLRIAYLIAFQKFGHGFLINGGLYKVREQITNPDKVILPRMGWLKYTFPENCLGVNIINKPKELQCFLVIFNLRTASSTYQYAVMLPGPSEPGAAVYENLAAYIREAEEGAVLQANMEHLGTADFVGQERLAFASHALWQKHTEAERA